MILLHRKANKNKLQGHNNRYLKQNLPFSEPWRQLGVNLAGLLAIYVWAAFWSTAIFGILWKVKMLRIDRETEFRGNDMVSKVR